MKKLFVASAFIFLIHLAHAATALQWGVDRTTTPWTTCVYDANNVCQGVFTVPATGGGALTPPSHGGTGVNNGINTFTIGGNVAFSGVFTFTGTLTGNTAVTFPTSGTLATTATPASSIVVGSTIITGGSPGNIEFNNGGFLGETNAVPVPHGGTGQTTFTANQPILGNGASSLVQGTLSGNQTKFATVNGSPVSGHCASWDGSGNVIDAGGACTTGGGGGTVSAGTANNLGYYATSSTVISPLATANNGVLVTNGSGVPSISTTLPNVALGTPSSLTLTNASGLPLSGVAAQAANTVAGNATASSAALTALAMPSCSGAANALIWTTSGGFGCNSLSTGTITGVTAGTGLSGGGTSGTVTVNLSTPVSSTNGGSGISAPAAHTVPVNEGSSAQNNSGTGAAGQALFSNGASADPSYKSGAPVLLNTLTSGYSDTTSLTATYSEYEIYFENIIQSAASCQVGIQFQSGGSFQTTGYLSQITNSAGGSVTPGTGPTNGIPIGVDSVNTGTGPGFSGNLKFSNPSSTTVYKLVNGSDVTPFSAMTAVYTQLVSGFWNSTAAITGVQMVVVTGACTINSGTIKIYGWL